MKVVAFMREGCPEAREARPLAHELAASFREWAKRYKSRRKDRGQGIPAGCRIENLTSKRSRTYGV
jgi:hypothetical protein